MIRTRTPASRRLRGIAPPDGGDRRLLRLCFAAAVLLHGGLLLLPVPWADAAAAPEPPPRVVHVERLRDLRAPEPPAPVPLEPHTGAPEPRVPIPVPEDLVDEEPPLDDAPLPAPDLDTLAEVPVILLATIDKEGLVTDLEVLRGEPLGLTEAALAAVRRWRFRPATLEERPVAVYYHLTVRFETR